MPIQPSMPSSLSRRTASTRTIVSRSGGGLRGWFSSARFPNPISFEGDTEKEVLLLLDLSSRVLEITPQPFKDEFLYAGTPTSRTPDFLVKTTTGTVIVECKSSRQLDRSSTRLQLIAAAQHFAQRREHYLVITDQTLRRGSALRNALMLGPHRPTMISKQESDKAIVDALNLLIPCLPCTVIEAAKRIGGDHQVRCLISRRAVHIDYSQPLTPQTVLHPCVLEESQDAAFFLFGQSALQMEKIRL